MNISNYLQSAKTLNNGGYLRGAHHPHCDRHHNHLIWIAGHPLCLGCTCMYSGIAIGIPLALVIDWSPFSFPMWIIFHWALLLPTILQFKIQKKFFKMTSRFFLGVGSSLYFVSGLIFINPPFSEWVFRFTVILTFIVFYRVLKQFRERYSKSPCDNCPLGQFPTCEWNLPRLLDNDDTSLLLEVLSTNTLQNLLTK